jgi:N-acetyl-gamma-glutamyl-phosphate reductase
MNQVFIDGQAGTTGLQIAERLALRADLEVLEIDPQARKDDAARQALMAQADVTILCLPDAAVAQACELAGTNARILDASSVHRTHDDWVYGLPEFGAQQRQAIRNANRVSNPGCYPQGYLLSIRPLVQAGLLPAEVPLSMHAVSGYSGGGRAMVERYQAFTEFERELLNTRTYALSLEHKHLPEMFKYSGSSRAPVFVPSVATYYQGMLTHIPLHRDQLPDVQDAQQIVDAYTASYAGEPFVDVLPLQAPDAPSEGFLDATTNNGTNRIELMVFANTQRLLLVARYDNLGKGAAGVAVQNLNLMLGCEETLGLEQ